MLVVGPNGAGKTNLLESLHVGTQGFSPRTRSDSDLIRFGEQAADVAVRGERAGVPVELEVALRLGEAKEARLNGARLRTAEQLRAEVATLVFTPDRLVVVKGPPAARRAYFDRVVGRIAPAKAKLSSEYGATLAQRNAALRRVAAGFSARDAIAPWTERVAQLAAELVAVRHEVTQLLQPGFAEHAGALGLAAARLEYEAEPPTKVELEARLDRDLERGATGLGPHLDDVAIVAAKRDLRTFGSQGEQRIAVLALLLAEAELVRERRSTKPLLLLDDVLSELDPARRETLAERIRGLGQAIVTSTTRGALPIEPDELLEVAVTKDGESVVTRA